MYYNNSNFGYLMQRCELVENKIGREHFNKPLSQLLDFDYMGSAEFEFGAFRNKYLCNVANSTDMKWIRFDCFEFKLNSGSYISAKRKINIPVFIYVDSGISDEAVEFLRSRLLALMSGKYRAKEYNIFTRGEFHVSGQLFKDFELDGDNEGMKRRIIGEIRKNVILDYSTGVTICFGEKKLPERLAVSVALSVEAYKAAK